MKTESVSSSLAGLGCGAPPRAGSKWPAFAVLKSAPLIVINLTQDVLEVTGSYGGDLSNVASDSQIGYKLGRIVAYYNTPGGNDDNWDWVYLENLSTGDQYQIYVEWRTPSNATYASFGYYDASSSESNSDPSPFPDGCQDSNFITAGSDPGYPVYILKQVPPSPGK